MPTANEIKALADRIKAATANARAAQAPKAAPAKAPVRAPAKVAAPVRAPAKVNTPVAGRQNLAPAKPTAKTQASSSYSGGSSGGGGGESYSGGSAGGGDFSGGVSAASFEPAAPVMQDVTIPDPLASEPYKRAKAEMLRARGDFDAQQQLARGQYDATFDDAQRQMGWRSAVPRTGLRALQAGAGNDEAGFDPGAQGTAYGDAYGANQGDFAGRGLFNSGLYLQALSNMNGQFNDRRNSSLRDQKDWRDTQSLNQRNFYGQQEAADAAAQEDAIGSIMAQLGVGRDQVIPGRQNVIQRAV